MTEPASSSAASPAGVEPSSVGLPAVSIVIPHHESPGSLWLVLSALERQTHPLDDIEVVIADDGSATDLAPVIPPGLRVATRVVTHQRQGARRGATRNLGVAASRGALLVFLDADMVPDPGWLAAHVSAHREGASTVIVGDRVHVVAPRVDIVVPRTKGTAGAGGPTGPSPETTGRALEAVAAAAATSVVRPEWRNAIVADTDELRAPGARGWRIAGGGNLSMTRAAFDRAGGFSEAFEGWGGEDLELAYRLAVDGATFVWAPLAMASHLGLQATPSREENAQLMAKRRLLADRIADREIRAGLPSRRWSVPLVVVEIASSVGGPAEICAAVDDVLAAEADVAVSIVTADDDVRAAVQRSYAAEPRVRLATGRDTDDTGDTAGTREAVDIYVAGDIGDTGVAGDTGEADHAARVTHDAARDTDGTADINTGGDADGTRWSPVRGTLTGRVTPDAIRAAIDLLVPSSTAGVSAVDITSASPAGRGRTSPSGTGGDWASADRTLASFHVVADRRAGRPPATRTLSAAAPAAYDLSADAVDDLDIQRIRNLFWRLSPRTRRVLARSLRLADRVRTATARTTARKETP